MSFKAHEHSLRSLGLMPLLDNSGRRDGSIPSTKIPEKASPKTNASKYSSVFKFVCINLYVLMRERKTEESQVSEAESREIETKSKEVKEGMRFVITSL